MNSNYLKKKKINPLSVLIYMTEPNISQVLDTYIRKKSCHISQYFFFFLFSSKCIFWSPCLTNVLWQWYGFIKFWAALAIMFEVSWKVSILKQVVFHFELIPIKCGRWKEGKKSLAFDMWYKALDMLLDLNVKLPAVLEVFWCCNIFQKD